MTITLSIQNGFRLVQAPSGKKQQNQVRIVSIQKDVDNYNQNEKLEPEDNILDQKESVADIQNDETLKYRGLNRDVAQGNMQAVQKAVMDGNAKFHENPVHLAKQFNNHELAEWLEKNYINSDELIENGEIRKLIEAICDNIPLYGKWSPTNYAAKCGQFYLVNWLMTANKMDIKVY